MNGIDDIINALGAKHISGLTIEPERKAAPPAPEPHQTSRPSYPPSTGVGAPKIFPSDRMLLRSKRDDGSKPSRPAISLLNFSDEEMEQMLATPVRRGWEFSDWLEVIGLPRDLHEKHDTPIYGYAARAFVRLKQDAHRR